MPDTKPDLWFDEAGVCSACLSYEQRPTVDWAARRKELVRILDQFRSKDGSHWDCIVPVSGGKDSTYQVSRLLEFGNESADRSDSRNNEGHYFHDT